MTQVVQMHGVRKGFRGKPALREIDWSVPAGSIYGLIGANGAGKTTLLRLALGVLWPDAGTVEVLGERLERENARMRERVHDVASDRAMAPAFRVDEWLRYAGLAYPRWDPARARRLVEALELSPNRAIGELSSGQRTSLQIAVAAACRPDLLLVDEPTNGLDVVVKTQVLQLILDMAGAEGTAIVFATHHIADVERLADRLAVLLALVSGLVLITVLTHGMVRGPAWDIGYAALSAAGWFFWRWAVARQGRAEAWRQSLGARL